MHKFDFKNRTAVITGGAQGFGLDIAKRFLESGARVFIWDVDEKLLKLVIDQIKNPNLASLESFGWIIGALISFILYSLLNND